MTTIKDHSESEWGFFVEMDSYSHEKMEKENYFKKLYFKINQMSTICEEEEEEDEDEALTTYLYENHMKKMNRKKTIFQLFHYSTGTFVIFCFAYFVFCVV